MRGCSRRGWRSGSACRIPAGRVRMSAARAGAGRDAPVVTIAGLANRRHAAAPRRARAGGGAAGLAADHAAGGGADRRRRAAPVRARDRRGRRHAQAVRAGRGAGRARPRGDPPWTGAFATLPFRWLGNRVVVAAAAGRARGHRAARHGGAVAHRLDRGGAGPAPGCSRASPAASPAASRGRESVYHWHRFRSLAVGGERVAGPVLTVAPLAEDVDMLLGADWFAAHVVWLSYSTGFVFVRPAA